MVRQWLGWAKTLTAEHDALKETARKILIGMGFQPNEIKEEYQVGANKSLKSFRVDIVGIRPDKQIAIECGSTSGEKIAALKMFFDDVIVLPYFTLNIEQAEYTKTLRLLNEKIQFLEQDKIRMREKLESTDSRRELIRHIFEDTLELLSRFITHSNFYTQDYDKADLEIIEKLRRQLEELSAKLQTEDNKSLE